VDSVALHPPPQEKIKTKCRCVITVVDLMRMRERSCVKHYATSREVEGSNHVEVIEFFLSIYLLLPAVLWPWDWLSL
jgi:hypothetical protein